MLQTMTSNESYIFLAVFAALALVALIYLLSPMRLPDEPLLYLIGGNHAVQFKSASGGESESVQKKREAFTAHVAKMIDKLDIEILAEEFARAHKGYSVLLGLVIHTFFDGIAITSGFLVSNWLGWIIFLAVFLHKIPEGFTVSSVMLASGRSRSVAWAASALLGAATFAGCLTMVLLQRGVSFGLPVSAGVTIYVAASDLIPEVNQEKGIAMAALVFIGVGCMFMLDHFFHLH